MKMCGNIFVTNEGRRVDMNIVEAYDLLQSHTFFARPYYNRDKTEITSFDVDFQDAVHIFPIQSKSRGKVIWYCEFGNFHIESGCYSIWVEDIIRGRSYEDCIRKLARWLVKKFGKDNLMDYFIIDENCNIETEKTETGYLVKRINNNSYWLEKELMEKIRRYGDE